MRLALRTCVLFLAFVAPGCGSTADTADAAARDLTAPPPPPDLTVVAPPEDLAACTLVKPYSTKNAACNRCAEVRCCQEINACLGDPECDDSYVNCMIACTLPPNGGDAGISTCLTDCATQYATGKAEYEAAIGCADTRCATECK